MLARFVGEDRRGDLGRDFEVGRGEDLAGLERGYVARGGAYFLLMRGGEVFAGEVALPFAADLLAFFGAILCGWNCRLSCERFS